MQIYVTGIHTDTGKTHASIALCKSFNYDYFKLIQAGMPKDSDLIATFSPNTKIFEDGIFLHTPASPHIGKIRENACYNGLQIPIPTSQNLIIEIAGGLFTPLDDKYCMIDYIECHPLPAILVGKYYLGCINHILLSIQALEQKKIPILCCLMIGEKDKMIDSFISEYTGIKIIHLDFFTLTDFIAKANTMKKEMCDRNITL